MSAPSVVQPAPRSSRLRHVVGIAITAAVALLVVYVTARNAGDVAASFKAAEALPLLGAAACHALLLGLRSTAWHRGLGLVGPTRTPASTVHRASAVAFLVGSVHGALALPARIAIIRRLNGGRGPTVLQTGAVDVPIVVVEMALLFAIASLWHPAFALGAAVVLLGILPVARRLRRTASERSAFQGLAVAADGRELRRLVVTMSGVVLLSSCRTGLVLLAFHLPADPVTVAKVVAATTVLSALPLGLGTGPAAMTATMATGSGAVASQSLALSAGLAFSAATIVGILAYGIATWTTIGFARAARRSPAAAADPAPGLAEAMSPAPLAVLLPAASAERPRDVVGAPAAVGAPKVPLPATAVPLRAAA